MMGDFPNPYVWADDLYDSDPLSQALFEAGTPSCEWTGERLNAALYMTTSWIAQIAACFPPIGNPGQYLTPNSDGELVWQDLPDIPDCGDIVDCVEGQPTITNPDNVSVVAVKNNDGNFRYITPENLGIGDSGAAGPSAYAGDFLFSFNNPGGSSSGTVTTYQLALTSGAASFTVAEAQIPQNINNLFFPQPTGGQVVRVYDTSGNEITSGTVNIPANTLYRVRVVNTESTSGGGGG